MKTINANYLDEHVVAHEVTRVEQAIKANPKRFLLLMMISAKWLSLLKFLCQHGEYRTEVQTRTALGERKCRRRCQAFKILVTHILLKPFTPEEIYKIRTGEIVSALKGFTTIAEIFRIAESARETQAKQTPKRNEVEAAIRRITRIVESVQHVDEDAKRPLFVFLVRTGTEGGKRCKTITPTAQLPVVQEVQVQNINGKCEVRSTQGVDAGKRHPHPELAQADQQLQMFI